MSVPEFLYMLPGDERAWDDPAECFDASEPREAGDREPMTIEVWTARPAAEFLPTLDATLEYVAEHGADEMGTEDAARAWDRAASSVWVRQWFRAALDLLGQQVNYRMCGEKVGTLTVTFDADGNPLLDGEPMYVPVPAEGSAS